MPHSPLFALAHALVAILYLVVARQVWTSLARDAAAGAATPSPAIDRWALPVLALAHSALLAGDIGSGPDLRFGFALTLSSSMWLTVVILWIEGLFVPLRGLHPIVLPAAAAALVLPLFFPGFAVTAERSLAFKLHIHAAIFAYALMTVAALHALLMAFLNRELHRGAASARESNRLLRHAPPLLSMERLLFRLILAGFALLTLAIGSGLLFSRHAPDRAAGIDQKMWLALASWVVFAGLLSGRALFGWRGGVALRWVLWGFMLLLLAYTSSRFMLELLPGSG